MKNYWLYLLLFSLIFTQKAQTQTILINEYSAANVNGILDNDNDRNDWIELYNTTSETKNLEGYYLSDKKDNPTKWQIPAGVSINANGFSLFFASGKNIVAGNYIHTNFKITQCSNKDYIMLANPDGIILDSVKVERTQINHSRGRTPNGGTTWGLFTTATPKLSNGTAYTQYLETPEFNPPAGFYNNSQTLTISTSNPADTIRYTTDGSTPNANSTIYTSPININSTTIIKARSYNGTLPKSFIETNTYFINENFTLPVISVSGDYEALFAGGSNGEIKSTFEFFDFDKQQKVEGYGDMHGHGNDSWNAEQKGIRFYARDQYGVDNNMKHQFFNTSERNEFDVLIIRNAGSDNYPTYDPNKDTHLRDAFAQTVSEKFNLHLDERKYQPCIVFVNGQYWGIYEMRERTDTDYTNYYYNQPENKVDMLAYYGGLTIEAGSDTGWINLYNYIVGNDMTIDANYEHVLNFLDINSFIDYFIFNTYVVNTDWLNWNTRWWRGRKGDGVKWRYALWDFDNIYDHGEDFSGIGNTNADAETVCTAAELFTGTGSDLGQSEMYSKLKQNHQFVEQFANRYADLFNTAFQKDTLLNHLNKMVTVLMPEMPKQCQRWNGSMPEWLSNVQHFRDQISERYDVIASQIVDCYDEVLDAPLPITVIVQPEQAGIVQLNTTQIQNYPFTGTYFTGINIPLTATANPEYVFSYWEVANNTFTPSPNDSLISLNFAQTDTVIAHFKLKNAPQTFVFVSHPDVGGVISVNGNQLINSPTNLDFLQNETINISASPNISYAFEGWEASNNAILPNNTAINASFTTQMPDTIVAHFSLLPANITFSANPNNGGTLIVNGTLVQLPHTQQFTIGEQVNIIANANAEYVFSNYETQNLTLLPNPNTPNVSFTVTATDSITANFIYTPQPLPLVILMQPNNSGTVLLNNSAIVTPYSSSFSPNAPIQLTATANTGFVFDKFSAMHNTLLPNNLSPNINFTMASADTIITIFKPSSLTLTINSNIANAGIIKVNGNTVALPNTQTFNYGTNVLLQAQAQQEYIFNNWQSNQATLDSPNNTDTNCELTTNTTVTAFFSAKEPIPVTNISVEPTLVNEQLTINYELAQNTPVECSLYAINGQLVYQLINTKQASGKYTITNNFSTLGINSGTYFLYFKTSDYRKNIRIVYIK